LNEKNEKKKTLKYNHNYFKANGIVLLNALKNKLIKFLLFII